MRCLRRRAVVCSSRAFVASTAVMVRSKRRDAMTLFCCAGGDGGSRELGRAPESSADLESQAAARGGGAGVPRDVAVVHGRGQVVGGAGPAVHDAQVRPRRPRSHSRRQGRRDHVTDRRSPGNPPRAPHLRLRLRRGDGPRLPRPHRCRRPRRPLLRRRRRRGRRTPLRPRQIALESAEVLRRLGRLRRRIPRRHDALRRPLSPLGLCASDLRPAPRRHRRRRHRRRRRRIHARRRRRQLLRAPRRRRNLPLGDARLRENSAPFFNDDDDDEGCYFMPSSRCCCCCCLVRPEPAWARRGRRPRRGGRRRPRWWRRCLGGGRQRTSSGPVPWRR
mmetsp:Transcript_2275/g.5844  ORF Transcript_2275/g.5844 Transcript_2275/m.5844 type:complete len:333 (+) Transcript_2275:126-1124(+)